MVPESELGAPGANLHDAYINLGGGKGNRTRALLAGCSLAALAWV